MSIHWNDYGVYDHELPDDWRLVTGLDRGGGWDWTTLWAFWSPTARRYFWSSGSGCSCDSWGDGLRTEADFENGSRSDLLRAVRRFAFSYHFGDEEAIEALNKVRRFKETSR